MKHRHVRFDVGFHVVLGEDRSQAAQMTLAPEETEGAPENRHRGADQWLYVIQDTGLAIVNERRVRLEPGTLLFIERGDRHEVRNTGRTRLQTLNFYVPPAYTPKGNELPAGRS